MAANQQNPNPPPPVRYRLRNGPPVDNRPAHPAGLTANVITGNGINYYGGPVIVNPTTVYYIYYGNWTTLNPGAPPILEDLVKNIGGSPYFNINTTYYDGSNTHVVNVVNDAGSTTDNYSYDTTLSDLNIYNIVANAISSNRLPSNTDALYFVLTSKDVHESSGFGSYYCG